MDKASEQRLLQMMESLFARQSEEMKARYKEAAARQEKAKCRVEGRNAMERQELFKEETYAENIGSSEDRFGDRRLVVRQRSGPKTVFKIVSGIQLRHT
jgi:ATP-dependent 26S proteasome regulatory subunit